jgi:hypothetical protein
MSLSLLFFKFISLSSLTIILCRWVGRLRTVGIQRGAQEIEDTNTMPTNTVDNDTYELTTDMHTRTRTSTSTRTSSYDFDFNFSSSSASSPLPSSPSLYMRQRGHERSGSMQSMGSVDEGYGSVAGGLLLVVAAPTPMRKTTPTPTHPHPQARPSPFPHLLVLAPPRIGDHPRVCPPRRVCTCLGTIIVPTPTTAIISRRLGLGS